MERRSVFGGFTMNRFLPFINYAWVAILVSSCAPNPHYVVHYGSAPGAPHPRASRHHLALAQGPLRHPPRRVASEGQRKLLSRWNYLPPPAETPAPPNATTAPQTYEIVPPHYWRWKK
jgi:hypothetical protein